MDVIYRVPVCGAGCTSPVSVSVLIFPLSLVVLLTKSCVTKVIGKPQHLGCCANDITELDIFLP